jgi:AcrR family transcriptional regulator
VTVRKGEATRLEILEAALPLASKVGLSGLSIGALAEALGMSKSGLFAHFRSKEALGLALVDHAGERFLDRVIRPTLKAPRGVPRIRAFLENWLAWLERDMAESGCFFAAAAIEFDDREGPVKERLLARERDYREFMTIVVRTALSEGHFRADVDVDQFVQDLFGIQFATQHYSRVLRDPKACARARHALAVLIDTARAPNAST